jgi:hypothetical protein
MWLGKQERRLCRAVCTYQAVLVNINKRLLLTMQTLHHQLVTSLALRKRGDMRKLDLPAYRSETFGFRSVFGPVSSYITPSKLLQPSSRPSHALPRRHGAWSLPPAVEYITSRPAEHMHAGRGKRVVTESLSPRRTGVLEPPVCCNQVYRGVPMQWNL